MAPGGNNDLHQPGVDHLADHQPHLGDAHGPGNRQHAGAVGVVGHGPQDLECLAQLAAAEGRLGHPPEQIGKALRVPEVERFQGLQAVVSAVVQNSGHDSTFSGNVQDYAPFQGVTRPLSRWAAVAAIRVPA